MLGQMMEPLIIKSQIPNPKSQIKKPWALTGCKNRKPNIIRSLYLAEGALEKLNLSLQKKYKIIQQKECRCEDMFLDDAKIILVAYGTMARIAKSVVKRLRDVGTKVGLIRPITLWPFPDKIFKRITINHKRLTILAIEMSYGQMLEDVKLSVEGKAKVEFLGRAGGGMPTEEAIVNKLNRLVL
jgi:2-oxoglutarate ferredoxin oxidoreductase subunit alpha